MKIPTLLLVAALTAFGCSSDDSPAKPEGEALTGLLSVSAGSCDSDTPTGSWFRMVQSGGTVADGPFVANPDTTCPSGDITPLRPGSDGGITLGDYQPQPDPPFDGEGRSLAGSITVPTPFFAVPFGLSTNPTDPQTGEEVAAPTASHVNGALTVDLSSLSVGWNGQHFNQGAPKPAEESGGPARGAFNPDTGAFTLEWTSLIEGGPFDKFTGIWHIEGIFQQS